MSVVDNDSEDEDDSWGPLSSTRHRTFHSLCKIARACLSKDGFSLGRGRDEDVTQTERAEKSETWRREVTYRMLWAQGREGGAQLGGMAPQKMTCWGQHAMTETACSRTGWKHLRSLW